MNLKHLIYLISFFVPVCVHAHSGDHKPIEFVRNDGQWDGPFVYKATYGNINLFLEKNTFTYVIGAADNTDKITKYKHGQSTGPLTTQYHAYKVHLLNALPEPEITGSKPLQHYYNYYLGNEPSKWKSFIYPNLAVDYTNVYNGIDMHIASEGRNIKYDFIVHPGSDPGNIQLEFEGIDDINIKGGNIVIQTSVGEVFEMAPYAYQYINGERKEVTCKYKLKGNMLSYNLPKGYDKTTTLVIDPNVVFSTFTGSPADNWGNTATFDNQGNFYAGGVAGGPGYPNPTNIGQPYQGGNGADSNGNPNPGIATDITITKFNPGGTAIIYSTYIGGTSQEQPNSMFANASEELFIAGRTYSSNFPATNGTYGGKADIIVIKLNTNGTLNTARFIGGSLDDGVNISSQYGNVHSLKHSYADDGRTEILLDNSGNVYVAACTKSTDFPTVNATKSSLSGIQDGVVFKLSNNLSNILWSTYIGGNDVDAAYVLAFNKAESSVYVSGGTASSDFTGVGGLWNSYQGNIDGFITKYQNSGGYPVQKSTLVGTPGYDQCFGIQTDDQDNVYVMGNTLGGTFPVTGGVYSNTNGSQFILKLNSDLNTNIYSTVFGSGSSSVVDISPVALLVDTCQNIYISGWGGATAQNGGSTANLPTNLSSGVTPAGILTATSNGNGFYFIVLSKDAANLIFAAHFSGGGPSGEHVDGGTSRFNKNGEIYQAICGGCGGSNKINVTQNAYSKTNGSTNCNLVALKIAFNLGSVDAVPKALPSNLACLGDPINFSSASSSNAINFEWNFGDGNTSTNPNPTYTYTKAGTFQVRLIASNPNACKIRDTGYVTVTIDSNSINPDFTVVQTDSCKPFNAQITNTSTTKNPATTTYEWHFGDGKTFSGINPGTHEYPDTGTYTIMLIMTNPNACNTTDTITKTISFNTIFVEAKFEGPPIICEKTKVVLNNRSSNASTFLWTFGDGQTSTEANPEPIYDTAGEYIITLYAYTPGSCNGVDSVSTKVTVESTPVANFRHAPFIPVTNEPITFENLSLRASSYIWDFGDNTFSQVFTPEPKFYRRTGRYLVCLQALNKTGCSDTICKYVDADVYPLADLPKAFSPNGDGNNDILYVRGAGIEAVNVKIYNRWAELVYEITDQDVGWDGKYNGKEAPVEAYAYVMNVTFIDGTTFYKKGNVTLLR